MSYQLNESNATVLSHLDALEEQVIKAAVQPGAEPRLIEEYYQDAYQLLAGMLRGSEPSLGGDWANPSAKVVDLRDALQSLAEMADCYAEELRTADEVV